jgi:hypothetical protein
MYASLSFLFNCGFRSIKNSFKKIRIYNKVDVVRQKLIKGLTPEDVLNEFPIEMVKKFAIFMHSSKSNEYLLELKDLGIKHIVFGYPQNFSLDTIKDFSIIRLEFKNPRK